MTEPVPIILTKLHPPLLRRNIFPRQRLVALVRQCVERRLTLVYAAPGYGKSTLIAHALGGMGLPLIWYSLSRSDRDPITFCSYLTEGFERQWHGFADAVRPVIASHAGAPTRPAAFVAACVNQCVAQAVGDFVVVLDDFQLVDRIPEICGMLDQFILHAPPQAHFVIATRSAPPFPGLPRLRALGEVLEIGEAELRFRPEEAAALFNHCLSLNLLESRVAALVEQTEGWALGLLLAGQSIKGGSEIESNGHLPEVTADRRILFEYLTEEVLRQQPPAVVDFLTSSAILSRLEPTLCDAALARSDSAARLRELEQHCLFVVRTEDGWLRYHRLFREFLLQQLADDPERLEALHRRAAAYFEEKQDFETAVFHCLEAGAYREASALIASLAAEMLRAGRVDTLEFWLGRLPPDVLAEVPELSFRWGQLCETRGQWDRALEHYARASQAYTARGDLLGLSDVLRSRGQILDWRRGKHAEAERLHREALGYVGEEHRRQRAALVASLARDQLSAGNIAVAQTLYREALAIYEAEADRLGQLDTLLNPGAWLYHSLGDFTQALAVLRRAEQLALELNSPRHLAETYNDMAVNLYFLGRYAESMPFAEKALALSTELRDAHNEAYALMNQANALEATCGRSYTDLYRQYQRALHVEQALGNRRFIIATLVFMMILARRAGNASEAVKRGQQALPLAVERGLRWLAGFVLVQLGAAQIWIDPAAAHASLAEALQIFDDGEDLYHLTGSHFWLAALYHSENNPAYLDHLRECLRLAVGHNYDCLFQSESQAAIPLLASALEHDLWPSYVAPILVKFGSRAAGSLQPLLVHADDAVRQRARAVLEEMGVASGEWRAVGDATRFTRHPSPVTRHPSIPPLLIHGFGNFAVRRGSHLVEEREWGRRKVKRLLKYIALSPEHTLPKDIALDLLWGDTDPQAANANFYRTLYNLRRVLEPLSPHSGANYIALEGGLIRLVVETVPASDVDDFVRGVEVGRRLARAGDRAAARDRLAAAVQLYSADLSTDDLYDDWIRPRREQLRDLYLSTLRDLAELATEAGQVDTALNYLRQAFRKDNTSEAACLNLMLALTRAGHRTEALQHYAACERALAELDLSPSAELHAAQRDLLAV
ncbi:MAG: transcriptional regulator [Anaerolineales bacterium]|nr:transcriptional regulator [Anaerolineales bacterium]